MRLCVRGKPTSSLAPTCRASDTASTSSGWEGDQSITHVPTAGRVVDHVGFEVKNLDAFSKALEAKGIKLVRPYKKRDPAMNNIATATIVDPWGVSIELTEGLDKIK